MLATVGMIRMLCALRNERIDWSSYVVPAAVVYGTTRPPVSTRYQNGLTSVKTSAFVTIASKPRSWSQNTRFPLTRLAVDARGRKANSAANAPHRRRLTLMR